MSRPSHVGIEPFWVCDSSCHSRLRTTLTIKEIKRFKILRLKEKWCDADMHQIKTSVLLFNLKLNTHNSKLFLYS